jgi:2-polyprenyl-3-methyl-5-hydroxy-6-metoxy-1,4-benzoquinol methylase
VPAAGYRRLLSRRRRTATKGGSEAPESRRVLGPEDLDQFVADTDALGDVGSPSVTEFWQGTAYQPTVRVDESLDPFGEDYTEQQVALYREISDRDVDQELNEQTEVNVEDHLLTPNPYATFAPAAAAIHMGRVARAVQYSGLDAGSHVIDMGCGWGMSTEVMAYAGFRVTSLDINPSFVELVNRRADRLGHPVEAVVGRFDHIPGDTQYDGALFYECLHHAIRPWEVLGYVHSRLKPGGKLMIAGEPFNRDWRHWGIRTDPYSLYCIRKFGWFESGWTGDFLNQCLIRVGFEVERMKHEGNEIGKVVIARS